MVYSLLSPTNERKAIALLQRKENGEPQPDTKVWGFLVGVEVEPNVKPDDVAQKLSDACNFMEGTGDITVDILGEIETVDEPIEFGGLNQVDGEC